MQAAKKYLSKKYLESLYRYLHRFMPLTEKDFMDLLLFCEFRHFPKKAVIVQEGETENYLSMVIEGLVMKSVKVKKSEVILQLATEGHVVSSELSFLTRTPSPVVIQTLEPSTLLSISFNRMQDALEQYPPGEMLGRMILERMYIIKDERKFTWQSKDMRQRFLDYMEQHPHMVQRVPQKYLASYLNIKPETFSRLKHLTRKTK
ncbi:MAG: Crp/Fnr family transcriptional regulator [Bacteroidetes bacterium]|nr:Crp/Fnr family transcriptional regulator [Bacteroidota bacterium]